VLEIRGEEIKEKGRGEAEEEEGGEGKEGEEQDR
jgi:hypothetical protein